MNHRILFIFAWVLISFYAYWPVFNRFLKQENTRGILLSRLYGAFLFGCVPLGYYVLADDSVVWSLGLSAPDGRMIWHIVPWVLILLVVFVSWIQAGTASNLHDFPQIREKNWSSSLHVWNILTWMIYLTGYELLFRGMLVISVAHELGAWPAIMISVGFYSLSHATKNFREGLATIPIGLILALLAWQTQSIWYPVIIHWAMSVSHTLFSYRHWNSLKTPNKK